ncbi:hypothetical protein Shyhy02_66010 [Streptomyces hygroscopicus subsp. hygroscopicus]|nr:hypothetical protein Shyhy02_66010 [Streptomyces hygroscopicus subsp. hygroscopicus]
MVAGRAKWERVGVDRRTRHEGDAETVGRRVGGWEVARRSVPMGKAARMRADRGKAAGGGGEAMGDGRGRPRGGGGKGTGTRRAGVPAVTSRDVPPLAPDLFGRSDE